MRPTVWQRVDVLARHQLPVAVTLGLILISVVPSHVPDFVRIGPMLPLISVYYWAVYRPDLLGHGTVFALGLLDDVIAGTPLGAGSLSLLLVHELVVAQHRFFRRRSFTVVWSSFIAVAAGAAFIKWLGVSAIQGAMVSGGASFFSYLMTVALYPLVSWMLVRLHITFLRDV